MAVALGIGDRAVDVEDQCAQHSLPLLPTRGMIRDSARNNGEIATRATT
jgi:hypothetical protein